METWQPKTKREQVAHTIAQTFHEEERVKLYLIYCKKYPLSLIFRAFSEAKSFPEAKIKKSRAALFFYLIKTYAHQSH